jgi:hypothetical protein
MCCDQFERALTASVAAACLEDERIASVSAFWQSLSSNPKSRRLAHLLWFRHIHIVESEVLRRDDAAESNRPRPNHGHVARLNDALRQAYAMGGGANHVEEKRRELRLNIVRDGYKALVGHQKVLGVTAVALPPNEAGIGNAEVCVAASAIVTTTAEHGNVDDDAVTIEGMARMLNNANDLVPRRDGPAVAPDSHVGAAERTAKNSDSRFASARLGQVGIVDFYPALTKEGGVSHCEDSRFSLSRRPASDPRRASAEQ